MPIGEKQVIRGSANRLRVFNYLKSYMELFDDVPAAHIVADELGLSKAAVQGHMNALRNADGLPFEIPAGEARRRQHLRARRHEATSESRDLCYLTEHLQW